MDSKDFCNWLSGYLEVANPCIIGVREIAMIREHLELARENDLQYNFGGIKFGITRDKDRPASC